MVYAWKGSGYIPQPKGPSCPVIHRDMDEPVSVGEIRSVLRQLQFDEVSFIKTVAGIQPDSLAGGAVAGS